MRVLSTIIIGIFLLSLTTASINYYNLDSGDNYIYKEKITKHIDDDEYTITRSIEYPMHERHQKKTLTKKRYYYEDHYHKDFTIEDFSWRGERMPEKNHYWKHNKHYQHNKGIIIIPTKNKHYKKDYQEQIFFEENTLSDEHHKHPHKRCCWKIQKDGTKKHVNC
jgi:hypothetical protein